MCAAAHLSYSPQDLRLALEPPPTKQQLEDAAAAAAGKGGQAGGSFIQRSLSKAGSFLRLDSLAGGQQQQQQSAGGKHTGGGDTTTTDEISSDDPELGRPISRAWSRSKSIGVLGVEGGGQQPQQQQPKGCLGRVVHDLGVADRGGASFFTQFNVLLTRSIKVGVWVCGCAWVCLGRGCHKQSFNDCARFDTKHTAL
jgi:hypothetical protein